jgi:hypothetical protein
MLKTGNLKEIESSLRDYVAKGDYSKPFVMIGWTRTGKTAIVNNIFGSASPDWATSAHGSPSRGIYEATSFADIFRRIAHYQQGIASKCVTYHIWDSQQFKRDLPELLNLLSIGIETPIPVIIEISYQKEEVFTTIVETGFDVYNVEFDRDLWFEWAEKIDTETGRRNVPMRYIKFLKESPAEYLHLLSGHDPNPGSWGPIPCKWALMHGREYFYLTQTLLLPEQIANSLYVDGDLDEDLLNKALNEVSAEKWNEWVDINGDSANPDNQAMSRAEFFFAVLDYDGLRQMYSVVVSNAYKEYCKKN